MVKLQSFKKFTKNNSETVTNKNDKEILKKRYIAPEERQKLIDKYNNEISKSNKLVRQ